MAEAKIPVINKGTAISISLVIAIIGGVFFFGIMTSKVEAHESRLDVIEVKQDESPSIREFDTLREDVKEIKEGVATLTSYLLKNN